MIQTLRVTSLVVGLLALGLIALSAVNGIEPDGDIQKILDATPVVERYEAERGKSAHAKGESAKSPLVAEAERYASIVNPPVATDPPRVPQDLGGFRRPPTPPRVRPETTFAKFTLEGTCYNREDPNASLAIIDEPGKGRRWVRQGEKLGHLVVQEVLDGRVKCLDGQRIEELRVMKEPKMSLYAGSGPKPKPKPVMGGLAAGRGRSNGRPNAISVRSSAAGRVRTPPRPATRPIQTKEDAQELEQIVNALKSAREAADTDKTPEEQEADRLLKEQTMQRLLQLRKNYMARTEEGEDPEADPNRE